MPERFLIGPMAKLGWGTPTLISLELGIILEIPSPVLTILGVLRMDVPAAELPRNAAGKLDRAQLRADAATLFPEDNR